MIYKFTSQTQTIISHKSFRELFSINKYELSRLMKDNPFSINNQSFTHEPITDPIELRKLMPNIFQGRPKGKSTKYSIITKNRSEKKEERSKKPPTNEFYYETVGNFILKKSTISNRLISTSMK